MKNYAEQKHNTYLHEKIRETNTRYDEILIRVIKK